MKVRSRGYRVDQEDLGSRDRPEFWVTGVLCREVRSGIIQPRFGLNKYSKPFVNTRGRFLGQGDSISLIFVNLLCSLALRHPQI